MTDLNVLAHVFHDDYNLAFIYRPKKNMRHLKRMCGAFWHEPRPRPQQRRQWPPAIRLQVRL